MCSLHFWTVNCFAGKKVSKVDMFPSKSQALEAAGLSEWSNPPASLTRAVAGGTVRATRRGGRMAWRIAGTYVANCSCNLICPCPVDGPPTSEDGRCSGNLVFHVEEGFQDDTDLGGLNVGLVNFFPSNLTSGGWKLGIVVDEGASDEQTAAFERIFKGEDGGPFADFAALTEEWLGTERGSVTFSDGDTPSGSIAGAEFTFAPLPGPEGSDAQATVRNAMFGFAPEFRIGRAPSHQSALGIEFDAIYGETADYEFSSEQVEGAPRGRG
jgi:hypothetical protein